MPYIPLEEVESSNIVAIGYHRQTQTLRIRFQRDRYYDYPMVTEREYKALMEAESKGQFFNSRIRPMYGHRNVRPEALVEPCCEHPGPDPTCTKECLPCNDSCCDLPAQEAQRAVSAAVTLGLATGASLAKAVRTAIDGRLDSCPHGEGGRACEVSCECTCHVSQVPPAVPLTDDGEIDVAKIPNVSHLFADEGDEAEESLAPLTGSDETGLSVGEDAAPTQPDTDQQPEGD